MPGMIAEKFKIIRQASGALAAVFPVCFRF